MIGRLSGQVLDARPDEVLLDVGGVGYRVQIPLSTFYRLSGEVTRPVALHVHTHVREDAIQLYGFWTVPERATFERLIGISGIGPRIALAVLSGIGVDDLERAVREGDRAGLERIPGIGRKTAERMLLELRDKMDGSRRGARARSAPPPAAWRPPGVEADAVSALLNLGYPEASAGNAVTAVLRELGAEASLEEILRASLRALVR